MARDHEPGFAALLRVIIEQQVSVQAGAAIWRKLAGSLGEICPDTILKADAGQLRRCGLSQAKTRYATCLAQSIFDGDLNLEELDRMDDTAARAALTKIKGIGRWTADIYLMCALDRPDIWPAGDLALAVAAQNLLNLRQRPTLAQLDQIGEQWRPWRTTAALMLWKYYRHVRSS